MKSQHRRSLMPELDGAPWLKVLVAVILVITAVVAVKMIFDRSRMPAAPGPTPTVTVSSTQPTVTHEDAARMVQPLVELGRGDMVLYDGEYERPLCKFMKWEPTTKSAKINCPEGVLVIDTELLTPVEPR